MEKKKKKIHRISSRFHVSPLFPPRKNKNPLRDTVRWLACETAANIRADEICASRKLHARRVEQRIKGSGGINFQRNLIRGGIKKKKKNQQKAKQQNNENVRRKGKWKKME